MRKLGPEGAKLYLRAYFRNEQLPTTPAIRRLEFARFFFSDSFNEGSPEFHIDLFDVFAAGTNFALAAPRGHAKTTVTSTEVLYRIVNTISHHIVVVSDTYSQARDIVDNIRQELESNNMLRWVYGDLNSGWHWTTGAFTTSNDVRVIARGSNMKVRGLKYKQWRPDFAVTDDLENDEAVTKPERREKLMKWIKMALLPAMARPISQLGFVGTILHEDSLLNNAINGLQGFGGYNRRKFAALIQNADGSLTSLWPQMFPVEDLLKMRDDPSYEKYLGPLSFAQEMQNEPVDDRSRIFKREWIYGTTERPNIYSFTAKMEQWRVEHQQMPESHTWLNQEIKEIIMAVDPAISEDTLADYFAMVVIGIDRQGDIWLLDVFRDQISDINVQVDKILEFNEKWHPDRIKIEAVAYQAGLSKAVQREAAKRMTHAPVFPVVPDKDKFRRAVIHSANFAGNLVHIRTDHPLFDAFVAELLAFPNGKNDDMLDAFMHAAEKLVQRYKVRSFSQKPKGW